VIDGNYADTDKPKIEAIASHLRTQLGDASLTILAVRQGSVLLEIESSVAAFKKMKELFVGGELTQLLGHSILRVTSISPARSEQPRPETAGEDKPHLFQRLRPLVEDNAELRIPQREGYREIKKSFADFPARREIGVVLPVGCGKSGLIAISPFAVGAKRVLVIAPGIRIASQLLADFDPSNAGMFYQKCHVLEGSEYPEPAEIRGSDTNKADLEAADVAITNIHQLQGVENKWISLLPKETLIKLSFSTVNPATLTAR